MISPEAVAPQTLATPIAAASGRAVTAAQLRAADLAVGGPAARAGGLSGAGLKIGIISDSFNLSGQAAAEQAAGLLPANGVTVLEEGPAGSGDEGMAMAELVHATAPAAQLYFYSGYYSEQDMAAGVAALRAAGCQIIVDDISYADEPMFQIAGPIDTAVQAAVSAGVDVLDELLPQAVSATPATSTTPTPASIRPRGVTVILGTLELLSWE